MSNAELLLVYALYLNEHGIVETGGYDPEWQLCRLEFEGLGNADGEEVSYVRGIGFKDGVYSDAAVASLMDRLRADMIRDAMWGRVALVKNGSLLPLPTDAMVVQAREKLKSTPEDPTMNIGVDLV